MRHDRLHEITDTTPMTQNTFPLWSEWLRPLVTLLVGILSFRLGMAAWMRSQKTGTVTAALAVGMAMLTASVHYPPMRDSAGAVVSRAGGESTLVGWFLLLLLGVAWKSGRQFARRPLLVIAAALAFVVMLIPASAPLAWRYAGQTLQANYPDTGGMIQQKTGMTCAPASAAMLLHRYEVRVSEGHLAEGAGTNPLSGTDEFALARAMERIATRNLHATAGRLNYETARRLARPFVAYVRRPGIGGHAILVIETNQTGVITADPLFGTTEQIARTVFEEEWSGVAIWLTPVSGG
jgi:hypothetical protein